MTETAIEAVSDEVQQLRERVGNGITWLSENDPDGSFHHWFKAGLSPMSPMPAQPPERVAAWREYHRQRTRWEAMSRDLARVDPDWRDS